MKRHNKKLQAPSYLHTVVTLAQWTTTHRFTKHFTNQRFGLKNCHVKSGTKINHPRGLYFVKIWSFPCTKLNHSSGNLILQNKKSTQNPHYTVCLCRLCDRIIFENTHSATSIFTVFKRQIFQGRKANQQVWLDANQLLVVG